MGGEKVGFIQDGCKAGDSHLNVPRTPFQGWEEMGMK